MPNPPHDDPLSSTLANWRVEPRRNPQFRAKVWERIHAAATAAPGSDSGPSSTWSRFVHAHAGVISVLIAAAVIAGALTGRIEARHGANADRSAIAAAYVHSLDARWMRHP